TSSQSANTTTGDGVAGQVIGSVSGGATSIDANNTSDAVDVTTGDGDSSNDQAAFVGLNRTSSGDVDIADFTDSCRSAGTGCNNAQDGNDSAILTQRATTTTGDGVAGEVIGAVTSAGGSASIVAANSSSTSDVTTGDADTSNDLAAFVGQNISDCSAFSAGPATCAAGSLSAAD